MSTAKRKTSISTRTTSIAMASAHAAVLPSGACQLLPRMSGDTQAQINISESGTMHKAAIILSAECVAWLMCTSRCNKNISSCIYHCSWQNIQPKQHKQQQHSDSGKTPHMQPTATGALTCITITRKDTFSSSRSCAHHFGCHGTRIPIHIWMEAAISLLSYPRPRQRLSRHCTRF